MRTNRLTRGADNTATAVGRGPGSRARGRSGGGAVMEMLEVRRLLTNSLDGIPHHVVEILDFADFINDAGIGDIPEPGWVYVDPAEKFKSITGEVIDSHATHTDLPTLHDSHDHNVELIADPGQEGLLSVANDEGQMELEW